jgi:hypothetical protein
MGLFRKTETAPQGAAHFAALRVVGAMGREPARDDVAAVLAGFGLSEKTTETWWRSRWLDGPAPGRMIQAGRLSELFSKTVAAVLAAVEGLERLSPDAAQVRTAREQILTRLINAEAPAPLLKEVEEITKGAAHV